MERRGAIRKSHMLQATPNRRIQFIKVQAMQEDEDGNELITVKLDVATVLREKREIQHGEFIRY